MLIEILGNFLFTLIGVAWGCFATYQILKEFGKIKG